MKFREPWFTQAHTLHRMVQVDVRRIVLQTILFGMVLSILLAVPVALYHRAEARNMASLSLAEQERIIQLAAQTLYQEMDAVLSDLRYLSQHIALKTYLEGSSDHRHHLALEYLELARQKGSYDQIRFIGRDGMEEVRVDHSAGKPIIRADQDLQDKHDRYYFEETRWLPPGQIYVSPFDLSAEQVASGQSRKPTIRFAVPVADNEGAIRGMVVLNYLGQRLIDKLGVLAGKRNDIWLLNAEGYWLRGPRRQDEWGFMFPQRPHAPAPFWQQAMTEKSGVYRSAETLIRFERIYPLSGGTALSRASALAQPVAMKTYHWMLAVPPSQSALQSATATLPRNRWAIYGALSLFAFLVSGGLAFAINRNYALSKVMEKVIDSLPVLVAYIDKEQRYRFNNMAYQRMFGLSPRDIYGKTMLELLGERGYQLVEPYIEQALYGKPVKFERQMPVAGSGTQNVEVSYLPDVTAQGEVRGLYVIVNDITQIKQSERRERQRMLELAHVSRLASMSEMATEIAHEINQPLAAIAIYSTAGLRNLHDECDHDQIGTWLEAINTQAKRASEIVRRVRRFVRKDELQRGPVDLNQVTTEVAALVRHEAQSQGVDIVLQLAEALPSVQGELILLEQVVFNLVRNAMDALLPHPSERRITLATSCDAERVYVQVRDTGPGIDPDVGERIFNSFVTNKQKGIGMGLTISRSIIEAHAGKLHYVVNPDGGATFVFSLARETR